MKRFFLGIATLAALTFSVASSASTLDEFSGNSGDSIYNDTGAQYVSLSDFSQYPRSAPMIEINSNILTGYARDYIIGIFDAVTRVELNVLDTFESTTSSNVSFGAGTATSDLGSAAIGHTFGFFIRFYEDIGGGVMSQDVAFSDGSFLDVFNIFHSPYGFASTDYSEVALGLDLPTDSSSTVVTALIGMNDVTPVPLPAAAWLFGSALIGLLGLGGRRKAATGVPA